MLPFAIDYTLTGEFRSQAAPDDSVPADDNLLIKRTPGTNCVCPPFFASSQLVIERRLGLGINNFERIGAGSPAALNESSCVAADYLRLFIKRSYYKPLPPSRKPTSLYRGGLQPGTTDKVLVLDVGRLLWVGTKPPLPQEKPGAARVDGNARQTIEIASDGELIDLYSPELA
jgi:hypothetical protein